ncbi:hypothetical protein MRBLWO14_001383 [Microbacterium sp. LWO14-1.2]|jgi:predicted CDP-diglyceride synthetase/phosphatidate cytidylyltransferase|uniref:hypothetical protein n=1 Tax=Microbacterium sp. LWO14-1.2 TaxID=3135263 RepID=UPI003139B773
MSVMTLMEPTLMRRRVSDALDDALVRLDGWWLVLIAALIVFGVAFLAALALWCFFSNGGRRFSGNWKWGKSGVSVWIECI